MAKAWQSIFSITIHLLPCVQKVCAVYCIVTFWLFLNEWQEQLYTLLFLVCILFFVFFFFVFLFYACFYNRFFLFFSGKIKCFSDKEVVNFKAILCVKAVFRGKRLLQGYKQKDRNSKRKSDGTPIKKLQSPQNILLKGRWSIAKIKRWT